MPRRQPRARAYALADPHDRCRAACRSIRSATSAIPADAHAYAFGFLDENSTTSSRCWRSTPRATVRRASARARSRAPSAPSTATRKARTSARVPGHAGLRAHRLPDPVRRVVLRRRGCHRRLRRAEHCRSLKDSPARSGSSSTSRARIAATRTRARTAPRARRARTHRSHVEGRAASGIRSTGCASAARSRATAARRTSASCTTGR